MCGIAGILMFDGAEVDKHALLRMQTALTHRGPDDAGTYCGGSIGLAHTRLSIIDLGGGHQPMCNEDGTVWIVFNGEIYNYKELRGPLESKGHVFKTNSDTEVILHLYEEYGIDAVTRLNGMFAIAIWDQNAKRLFLSRDRLGVKPLYYCATDNMLVFASEQKAILSSGAVPIGCNDDRVPEYLMFRSLAGCETLFKGILSLLPGHSMVHDRRGLTISQYWKIGSHPVDSRSQDDYLEQLSSLLSDSIRLRLRSDVPVGAFCSGGIDSSLVTALAASGRESPLDTFSVGFDERDFDESRYARLVSDRYATIHHELIVSNTDFADALPDAIWHNDEPLTHANSVPIYLLSTLAKQFVTVMLTGEGADELLGGYPRYFIPLLTFRYRGLPPIARQLVAYGLQPWGTRKAAKLRQAFASTIDHAAIYNSAFVDAAVAKALWLKEPVDPASNRMFGWTDGNVDREEFVGRFLLLEMQNYLVAILHRQDKMTMAAGIESRVPFLDYRLVEFCHTIPHRWKLKGFQNKFLLKRLAERFLPPEIVHRQKSGFGVPIGSWLKDPRGLGRYLDILRDTTFRQRGYFDQSYVDKMISTHLDGTHDRSEILFALINFELWHRRFMDTRLSTRTQDARAIVIRPQPAGRSVATDTTESLLGASI